MIGGLSDGHITVYVTQEEIAQLATAPITGTLIDARPPYKPLELRLQLDNEKCGRAYASVERTLEAPIVYLSASGIERIAQGKFAHDEANSLLVINSDLTGPYNLEYLSVLQRFRERNQFPTQ